MVWLRHSQGASSSSSYFLSCDLFSLFQCRHFLVFYVLRCFFFGLGHWWSRRYNFLVFFVQARERKFFWEKGRCFGSLHWSSLKLVVSTFDLVLMEILIIGSSVVAFVRPDLWLVFPDLVFLSRLWVVHHSTPINEVFWVGVLLGSKIWVLLFSR